jgi:hypothetical protein
MHLRKLRNYIGSPSAAVGDDVVDAGALGGVLAEELCRVVGELHGIERGAALFGSAGGVAGHAVKPELGRDARQTGSRRRRCGCSVPVQHGVAVIEQAIAPMNALALPPSSAGQPVAHRAGEAARLDLLRQRGTRTESDAEEMMAAGVTVASAGPRLRSARLLRQARQRIAHPECRSRACRSDCGGERRGDLGDAAARP